jgi:hypothetical protein
MKIIPGSRIVGKSGTYLTVDSMDGDILYCGGLKVLTSAVLRVIPPPIVYPPVKLKIGDRVKYIGFDGNLKAQYAGTLEVWEISQFDGYTCLKPNRRLTSWIEREDLQLVEVAK